MVHNFAMQMQILMAVRSLTAQLSLAAALSSFPCSGVLDPVSLAFAKKSSVLEELLVDPGKVHFVATNGHDQGPGTADQPWASINHAAEEVEAGDTVILRGGYYVLAAQVRLRSAGRPGAWITFIAYPGDVPILDAQAIQRSSLIKQGLDDGAFQIEGVSYVRVVGLTVINSHNAGFTVRDSSNIDLINNSTEGTFSSGIAVWATHHDDKTEHIRVLGNTVRNATTWDLAPPNFSRRGAPPHEALSIGAAVDFEVAYNHVYESDKEGIDVKDTSKRGRLHHNLINSVGRQGIYVDAWTSKLSDIEISSNVIHDCRGAGLVLSVENGDSDENINIHNNLIFRNYGSGLYFARWGVDHPRQNIQISHNVFYHNGYGPPKVGQTYYWLTGGLYLYSTNLSDISIANNIFSDNRGFQMGYSDLFVSDGQSWQVVARKKRILIKTNLIHGDNSIESPIISGEDPSDGIYAINGDYPILSDPSFSDPDNQDFTLRRDSPAAENRVAVGAYAGSLPSPLLWWKRDFPPRMAHINLNLSN